MVRYGNPQHAGAENKLFATHFRERISPQLLDSVMKTLAAHQAGAFITQEVHRSCLTYLSGAVEMSPTYKMLKPHLDYLMFQILFPTLCITEGDIKYVRAIVPK